MATDIIDKNIAALVGIDGAPKEEQERRYVEIGELIVRGVLHRAIGSLPEDQAAKIEEFAETDPTPEAMQAHLESAVPNFAQIVKEEVAAFKAEVMAVMGGTPRTA